MVLTGAGQIGMTIARRLGYGMKIVIVAFFSRIGENYTV